MEFHNQNGISGQRDQMAFLQFIQDGDCLALETGTEPCSQFLHGTDPLTGVYGIADTVYAEIRSAEVRIVAKHRVIKKTRTPAYANAPVCH